MAFINLLFRSKPIVQIAPLLATPLVPSFMSPMSDFFFKARVLVHVKQPRAACLHARTGPKVKTLVFIFGRALLRVSMRLLGQDPRLVRRLRCEVDHRAGVLDARTV